MTKTLRSKGKNTVVWVLMGMLVLGLGGFGVTNFSGGSTAAIGSVGETEIPATDYARALRLQAEEVARQTGKRPTPAEMQAGGIDRRVQAQLFTGAALDEEARRIGLSVGDDEIVKQLQAIPAFQGANGFNRAAYADLLRRENLTEAAFEADLRRESARLLLADGLAAAVSAPRGMADSYTRWLTETRDLSVLELSAAHLASPLPAPTDDELRAFHTTHAERFTRPETRRITYVSLTPEDLQSEVKLDDAALREAYDRHIDEYVRPARRMVSVLVFPDAQAAAEARARLDQGLVTLAALAGERGLTLADIDRGEVTQTQLGAAGEAVFAAPDTGIVGPVDTDLGPALVSVNAILEAQEIPFEAARDDLAAEAALDQARRIIAERSPALEDELASGASLEDIATSTGMKLGTIAMTGATQDGMAAYPTFRETAMRVTDKDFPELGQLADGGVFALRLDGIDPPSLIPFEEVQDQVRDGWVRAEMARALAARAEEIAAQIEAGSTLTEQGMVPVIHAGVARDGFIENMPPQVIAEGFALPAAGKAGVAEVGGRVFVVGLDKVSNGGEGEQAQPVRDQIAQGLSRSIADDLQILYTRAIQNEVGMTLEPTVINAVNAQVN